MPDVINSGEWIVYIVTDNFAKNINLAFAKLNIVDNGITYRPIAQLATQLVSGNNYAVLAEKSIDGALLELQVDTVEHFGAAVRKRKVF